MEQYWSITAMVWIGLAVITFVALYFFKVTAPFGRHSRTDWGPMVDDSLGWIIMEAPSLICLWISFLYFHSTETPVIAYIAMALWSIEGPARRNIVRLRVVGEIGRLRAIGIHHIDLKVTIAVGFKDDPRSIG